MTTQCSLCLTEVDERATVCNGCGAVKVLVRQRMGVAKGVLVIGLVLLGIVMGVTGRFVLFVVFLGLAVFVVLSQPKRLTWVKQTVPFR